MGLTIHYSLQCNGSVEQAQHAVEQLHRRATELPLKAVSPVLDLTGDECDARLRDPDDPDRWLLIQAGHLLEPDLLDVRPTRIIAFSTWPGEGCEPANFGLCRYPPAVTDQRGVQRPTNLTGWSWSSFCKTQFASDPSLGDMANFVRCHLSVIDLLDTARDLGVLGEVTDEGGFHKTRDVEKLVREVTKWNEVMAAFAGHLKDAIGPDLKASILAFPNFEHLEARGQRADNAD